MTQNPTLAGRVVVKRKGRDHSMSGADYSALLDRVAAKVKARQNGSDPSTEAPPATAPDEDRLYQRLYGRGNASPAGSPTSEGALYRRLYGSAR